jgi:membrane-associated protein
MTYSHFALYNITGAVSWVLAFLLAGYFFGQIPTIQSNFHIVIVAIIVISLLPIAFEFVRARRATPAA